MYSLKDADISIRRRALDLLFAMCDRSIAESVVKELLSYLAIAGALAGCVCVCVCAGALAGCVCVWLAVGVCFNYLVCVCVLREGGTVARGRERGGKRGGCEAGWRPLVA